MPETGSGGRQRAFGPVQPGAGTGAPLHGDLVPQREQLRVLGRWRTAKQGQASRAERRLDSADGKDTADHHPSPIAMTRRSPQVAGTGGFLVPLRLWKTELAAFAAQTGQRYLESLVGQEHFAAKHLPGLDRKSTRLNSSHLGISYA